MIEALLGMLPANEGLETDRPPAAQGDERLIVEHEFALLEGHAQAVLEREPLDGARGQLLRAQLEVVSTHVLGAMGGGVGVAQEALGVLPVAGYRAMPTLAVIWSVRPSI